MPIFLAKFLAPLAPYLAIAAVILVAVAYITSLRHDVAAAQAKTAALQQINQQNLIEIAEDKRQQVLWNAALDALDAQTLTTQDQADAIIGHIAASPVGTDGVVAPVLTNALNELRSLQAAP